MLRTSAELAFFPKYESKHTFADLYNTYTHISNDHRLFSELETLIPELKIELTGPCSSDNKDFVWVVYKGKTEICLLSENLNHYADMIDLFKKMTNLQSIKCANVPQK